ncbi:hypothetical protein EI94DRAFT_571519 [Lactarius quietus]|nr:hypothetical protein EI94DRAFT_571519 [Lactarius quietus]
MRSLLLLHERHVVTMLPFLRVNGAMIRTLKPNGPIPQVWLEDVSTRQRQWAFCDAKQNYQSVSIGAHSHHLDTWSEHWLGSASRGIFPQFRCYNGHFNLDREKPAHYRKTLPNGDWKLLRTPADIYMLSLFTYEIPQAIGGILNIRGPTKGSSRPAHIARTGRHQANGELGVALITLILTFIHSRLLYGE